jgi:hypothetical protein
LSVMGILLQLAYRLHRHFVAEWSLARWLGTALVLTFLAVLIFQRSAAWDVILLAALLFAYLAIMLWAGRKGYLHFSPSLQAEALLGRVPGPPPLEREELVPVRAAGLFTVHGREQHYVDLDADYESVSSREHIVLARVNASRFLWLGGWPDHEVGHWYVFFQPDMLRQVRAGYLYFGPQPRLAIEVVYAPDGETRHSIYLASEPAVLRRIHDDLMRDAPQEVSPAAVVDVG